MRISDWSSDVCSSDLPASPARFLLERGSFKRCASIAATAPAAPSQLAFQKSQEDRTAINPRGQGRRKCRHRRDFRAAGPHFRRSARSEEHTSELKSLMRISYAVFCLKNKTANKQQLSYNTRQR